MTLLCRDLQRNQFFTVAKNQPRGRWEQVEPRIQGEKKVCLEMRLGIEGEKEEREIIF